MASDIASWLETLGLGQYARSFAEHDIDATLLPRLDHELLKEIGVKSAGHRLRLLEAAAVLATAAPPPPLSTASATAAQPVAAPPAFAQGARDARSTSPAQAERRQLTVMFCDLVGSTELSTRIDPELLRELVRAFQQAVENVTRRYGGHIAQYLGDGVLVYFGYPVAHEDDAQRAVLAGINIPDALAQINTRLVADFGVALAARVGIHTGPVVVGEMGGGARSENLAMGETPNLAARLQAIAAPGTIVISARTQQLVGSMFELASLEAPNLKGLPAATQAFVVTGERQAETRFASGHAGGTGAMPGVVGRQPELALLLERWRQARSGSGQVVALSGEAGIGKSRIASALAEAVAAEPHLRLSYQCSPFHIGTALYPVARQLGFVAHIEAGDAESVRLDKLERLLRARPGDPTMAVRLLGTLLGLGELAQTRHGALALSPQQWRERTLLALLTQLERAARARPTLVVLEDAQWIDPTTHKLLELALDRIAGHRLLLLVTSRAGLGSNVGAHPAVSQLSLNRLGREWTEQIVHGVSRGKALPPELLREIVDRTDGVPLFVEELTRSVLESGRLRDTGTAYEFDGPADQLAIPSSLRDALMARLDRVSTIKELTQTAACIGREFSWPLLAAVVRLPESQLAAALEQMAEADLIFRRGVPPDATYLFKHALVRDAAYDSMLKTRRRVVHGELLAKLQADASVLPQVLAHHAAAAGRVAEAVQHWELAGSRAAARCAFGEAIGHFEQALECARSLGAALEAGSAADPREQILRLELRLAHTCVSGRGHASPLTTQAFKRALAVADALGRPALRFAAYYGYSVTQLVRCELGEATAVAQRLMADAEHDDDDVRRLMAHCCRATVATLAGDFAIAEQHFARLRALEATIPHGALVQQFGHEPRGVARCYRALVLWCLGRPGAAGVEWEHGMQLARASKHLPSQAQPTVIGALLSTLSAAEDMARRIGDAVEFTEQHGFQMWRGFALCMRADAERMRGDHAAALKSLHDGRAVLRASGTRFLAPLVAVIEARGLAAAGELDQALVVLEETQRHQELSGEHWMAAEVWRTVGDTLALLPDADVQAVEAAFQRAIVSARRQGACGWELRAVNSLAAWWQAHGEPGRAGELLQRACDQHPADEDSKDLAQARRLLARV